MLDKVCRTWFLWAAVSALALAVMACLAVVDDADAATWKKSGSDLKCGGSRIYSTVDNPHDYDGSHKVTFTVYKKSKSGKVKQICKVKAYIFWLCGYYKNKLYYSIDAGGPDAHVLGVYPFYVYNEKTKKKKRLIKDAGDFSVKGKYLIGTPVCGAWGPWGLPLYSVNMSKAKAKRISRNSTEHFIKGSKIYYLQSYKNLTRNGATGFKVMKCNLNGTGKKAISKLHYGMYFKFEGAHAVSYSSSGNSNSGTFRF